MASPCNVAGLGPPPATASPSVGHALKPADDHIVRAATRKNYLDPRHYEQLYKDLTTVMVVAGLLTAGAYQGLYTGYPRRDKDFDLPHNHRQFAWFTALNQLAFGCSVMAVFVAVAGIILLQQLQQWPVDCWKQPDPPKAVSTKYRKAEEFGKLEVHVRALKFVWHAHNHGVLKSGMQRAIEFLFGLMWFLLLASAMGSLAAAAIALHRNLGGFDSLFFRLVVIGFGTVTVAVSIVPILLARCGGGRGVSSPTNAVAISHVSTYSVVAASDINSNEWKEAIILAARDPYLFSKQLLWETIWYHAATVVELSEDKEPSFSKAAGEPRDFLTMCNMLVAIEFLSFTHVMNYHIHHATPLPNWCGG
jgi:hypothetical protein